MHMKITILLVGAVFIFGIGFYFGKQPQETEIESDSIQSKVITRAESKRSIKEWGVMDKYTDIGVATYGTENMVTAMLELLPGKKVHPPLGHAEEEFLLVIKGEGIWSIDDKEVKIKSGDLFYTEPWTEHSLTNTSEDTLTFFVAKWLNKGMPVPDDLTIEK